MKLFSDYTLAEAQQHFNAWGLKTGPCFVHVGADGKKESSPCDSNGNRVALTEAINYTFPTGEGYGIFGLLGQNHGGFICFDLDRKCFVADHSEASADYYLNRAAEKITAVLGDTYTERTTNGGLHLLYRCDDIPSLGGNYKLFGPDGDRWGELLGLGGDRLLYLAPTQPKGGKAYEVVLNVEPRTITSLDGLCLEGTNDVGTVACDGDWLDTLYEHFAPADEEQVAGVLQVEDIEPLIPYRSKAVIKCQRDVKDRSAELSFLVRSLCGWAEFLKQADFIMHPHAVQAVVQQLGESLGYESGELNRKTKWIVNHCVAKAQAGEPPTPYHPNASKGLPDHLVKQPAEQVLWIKNRTIGTVLAKRLRDAGIDVPKRRPTREEQQLRSAEIRQHLNGGKVVADSWGDAL
jgi:hypothetical protein